MRSALSPRNLNCDIIKDSDSMISFLKHEERIMRGSHSPPSQFNLARIIEKPR